MKVSSVFYIILVLLSFGTLCQGAELLKVSTKKDLSTALRLVKAGDTVELSSGTWDSIEIGILAQGTEEAPITVKGASDGSTLVTGQSCIEIGGRFITIRDLHFQGCEPPERKSSIVYFQKSSRMASDSRLTNCVFESCNPVDPERRYSWVRLSGDRNRVDHSVFSAHNHSGVTIQVKLENSIAGHRIDHNHFIDRKPGDGNGFECIQVGQSQDSLKNGDCVVDYNLFERCDGETEIISSKTGNNVFRFNTFSESAGTLTLRHGDNNLVERNVFLGNGKSGAGGIRVIGNGHIVRSNYMEGISDVTGGSIVLYSGIPDSPLNGYFAANGATIEDNLMVNCLGVGVYLRGGYGERGRTILPEKVAIKRNLIHLAPVGESAVSGELPDVIVESNITSSELVAELQEMGGFRSIQMELHRSQEGFAMPLDLDGTPLFSFGDRAPSLLKKGEVGPEWYVPSSDSVLVGLE
ncbi:MAG: polysaccharide lyase 6 family protein [Opitutaceae bacterium]